MIGVPLSMFPSAGLLLSFMGKVVKELFLSETSSHVSDLLSLLEVVSFFNHNSIRPELLFALDVFHSLPDEPKGWVERRWGLVTLVNAPLVGLRLRRRWGPGAGKGFPCAAAAISAPLLGLLTCCNPVGKGCLFLRLKRSCTGVPGGARYGAWAIKGKRTGEGKKAERLLH